MVLLCWLNGLIRRDLTADQVPKLPDHMTSARLSCAFTGPRMFLRLMPRELLATSSLDAFIALIIIVQPYILQWFLKETSWSPALALLGFGVGKALLWNLTSSLNCRIVVMIQSILALALGQHALDGHLKVRKETESYRWIRVRPFR